MILIWSRLIPITKLCYYRTSPVHCKNVELSQIIIKRVCPHQIDWICNTNDALRWLYSIEISIPFLAESSINIKTSKIAIALDATWTRILLFCLQYLLSISSEIITKCFLVTFSSQQWCRIAALLNWNLPIAARFLAKSTTTNNINNKPTNKIVNVDATRFHFNVFIIFPICSSIIYSWNGV